MIQRQRSHTEGSRPVSALGRYRDEMEAEGVLPPVFRWGRGSWGGFARGGSGEPGGVGGGGGGGED